MGNRTFVRFNDKLLSNWGHDLIPTLCFISFWFNTLKYLFPYIIILPSTILTTLCSSCIIQSLWLSNFTLNLWLSSSFHCCSLITPTMSSDCLVLTIYISQVGHYTCQYFPCLNYLTLVWYKSVLTTVQLQHWKRYLCFPLPAMMSSLSDCWWGIHAQCFTSDGTSLGHS